VAESVIPNKYRHPGTILIKNNHTMVKTFPKEETERENEETASQNVLMQSETKISLSEASALIRVSNVKINVGSEVLTQMIMKSSIFWDITPCSPLEVNRHFGGTC
jgi:hypothetical protein